ncbi:MAG: hypothetical protein SFY32_06925 [Bacteroidota bacterium]|nr:hypothetical protein [Bacteroidota bacterium]
MEANISSKELSSNLISYLEGGNQIDSSCSNTGSLHIFISDINKIFEILNENKKLKKQNDILFKQNRSLKEKNKNLKLEITASESESRRLYNLLNKYKNVIPEKINKQTLLRDMVKNSEVLHKLENYKYRKIIFFKKINNKYKIERIDTHSKMENFNTYEEFLNEFRGIFGYLFTNNLFAEDIYRFEKKNRRQRLKSNKSILQRNKPFETTVIQFMSCFDNFDKMDTTEQSKIRYKLKDIYCAKIHALYDQGSRIEKHFSETNL